MLPILALTTGDPAGQGHIAIKTIGFDEGVKVSLGTPIIRTPVDHGTAFDIAGKGVASPVSMIQSIVLATRLATSPVAPAAPAPLPAGR